MRGSKKRLGPTADMEKYSLIGGEHGEIYDVFDG